MLTGDPIVASAQGVDAAKTFLRLDGDGDDAVISALIVAATAQCETFLGKTVMRRGFVETLTISRGWSVLTAPDVLAITAVTAPDGSTLPTGRYETELREGFGWLRATGASPLPVRVTYQAGVADGWDDIPEPVRMGIVRLVAYYYAQRDSADDPGPPRGVIALWQPSRRMHLK